jgi:hypothetical protein
MARQAPIIVKILCTSQVKHVDQQVPLQAAECDDGMLRIFLGAVPLPDRVWPIDHVDDCIDAFLATSHGLRLGEGASQLA